MNNKPCYEWNDSKNERRFALIRKKNTEGLSDDEESELASAQTFAEEYFDGFCPRPDVSPLVRRLDDCERRLEKEA